MPSSEGFPVSATAAAAVMLLALPAAADLNAGNLTAKEFRGFCRDDNVNRCRDVITGVHLGLLGRAVAFTMDEQKLNRERLGCFPDETPTDELAVRVTQFFRDTKNQSLFEGQFGFAVSEALLEIYPRN